MVFLEQIQAEYAHSTRVHVFRRTPDRMHITHMYAQTPVVPESTSREKLLYIPPKPTHKA